MRPVLLPFQVGVLLLLLLLLLICQPLSAESVVSSADSSLGSSSVVELTDSSFEQLTQSSTGATTGDWLVEFYAPSAAQPTQHAQHEQRVDSTRLETHPLPCLPRLTALSLLTVCPPHSWCGHCQQLAPTSADSVHNSDCAMVME